MGNCCGNTGSDAGSETGSAATQEELPSLFEQTVEISLENEAFLWGVNHKTMQITNIPGPATSPHSVYLHWQLTSICYDKKTYDTASEMTKALTDLGETCTTKVTLTVRKEADQMQKVKVSKLAHQDLGLVFWQNSLVILQAGVFGASIGLRDFEGWRILAVDDVLMIDPSHFMRHTKDKTSFTLKLCDEMNTPSALMKIKRQLLRFIARSRLDGIMFSLTLRNLEIQEENEINSTKDEFESPEADAVSFYDKGSSLTINQLTTIRDDLIKFGRIPNDKTVVHSVISMARKQFAKKHNVHSIKVPETGKVTVVGDLHGQLPDLLHILQSQGMPAPNHHILFNGDYVDRGEHGVEVLLILLVLSLLHPDYVHLNRGNHEDRRVNAKYGFGEECGVIKYDLKVYNAIQGFFQALPLVHVAKRVVIMHGGLPEFEGLTLEEINKLNRFRPIPCGVSETSDKKREDKIMRGLLWSDPKEDLKKDFEKSKRGAGVYFSKKLTDAFLKANSLELIVRSHQTVDCGYKVHHGGRVNTVFSAANYRGKEGNEGAVMVFEWKEKGFVGARCVTWTAEDKQGLTDRYSTHPIKSAQDEAEDTKRDVLKRIRTLIFRKQVSLLKAFQEADLAEEGTVTPSQWVQCMRSILENIPWSFLSSYLVKPESSGMISYMSFLNRFQSRLLTRWVWNWCDAVMPHIILKIGMCIGDIEDHFREIDTDKTDALSYHELYLFLTRRQHLIALDGRLIVFILQYLDKNGDGFISLDEFRDAFHTSYNRIKDTPDDNELMRIWEARSTNPPSYANFELNFRNAETSDSKGISTAVFAEIGKRCLGGSSEKWKRTGKLVSSSGVVRFKNLQRAVKKLSTLYDQSQSVASILRRLSDSAVSLQSYYLAMDQTGRGVITKKQFCTGLKKFGITNAAWRPLWSLIDTNKDGYLSLNEFLSAFEVIDVSEEDVSLEEDGGMHEGKYDINSDYSSAFDMSDEEAESARKRSKRKKKTRKRAERVGSGDGSEEDRKRSEKKDKKKKSHRKGEKEDRKHSEKKRPKEKKEKKEKRRDK